MLDIGYSIKSLTKRPIQTFLLLFSITILSAVLFGGIVINKSLERGMDNMERRLGADVMIVPADAKTVAEDILLEGSRDYFYFNKSIYNDILLVDGVKEATAQMYLKSLTADCCSSEVQIVLFDPDTDFMLAPWIKEVYGDKLASGSAIIGSSVNIEENNSIKLFGTEYKVSARLARTGTSMDESVYFVFDTLPMLLADAEKKGAFILEEQKSQDIISTVFVNIDDSYKVSKVVSSISSKTKENIGIVYPKELANSISLNLRGIYSVIKCIIIAFLILMLIVLFVVYLTAANERKREISLFRILGASKQEVVLLLVKESIVLSIAGSVLGNALSALFVVPFGNFIGFTLGMTYLGPNLIQILLLCVSVTIMVVFIGIVASIYPAFYIGFMEPYLALRKEGE